MFRTIPCLYYCKKKSLALHRGETPMTRIWKSFAVIALAVMFVGAAPIFADDQSKNTDKPDDVAKTLKDVKKSVDEINEKLKSLDTNLTALRDDHGRDMQN